MSTESKQLETASLLLTLPPVYDPNKQVKPLKYKVLTKLFWKLLTVEEIWGYKLNKRIILGRGQL